MAVTRDSFFAGGPYTAQNAESFRAESDNLIASTSQVLDDSITDQEAIACSVYGSKGDRYIEGVGSVANAYVLSASDSLKAVHQLKDGMRFRFKCVNTNTLASTADINGIGPKAIEYGGSPLSPGMITAGNEIVLKFDEASDKLLLEYILTSEDLFVDPSTNNTGIGTVFPERKLTIDSANPSSLIDSQNITWSANQSTAFNNKVSEYGSIAIYDSSDGGFVLSGYNKSGSPLSSAISINSYVENDPTVLGAVNIDSFMHDGVGGLQSIGSSGKLLSISNNGVEALRLLGNGDLDISGSFLSGGSSIAVLPDNYIIGLQPSTAAADKDHDIQFVTGKCLDSTNSEEISLTSNITKQLDAIFVEGDGVGGRSPAVSLSANTTYFAFVIKKADGTVDVYYDTSSVAANIPSGFIYFRLIHFFRTNSSANIPVIDAYQIISDDAFIVRYLDTSDIGPVTPGGISIGYALNVPNFETNAFIHVVVDGGPSNHSVNINKSASSPPGPGNCRIFGSVDYSGGTLAYVGSNRTVFIRTSSSTGTMYVNTSGYTVKR